MAGLLERALAVQELLGSIPYWEWGGVEEHKIICGNKDSSGFVSFRRAVKRQWFHALKHTIRRPVQHYNNYLQTLIHFRTGS